jgi:uncharacterized membrane protein YqhA
MTDMLLIATALFIFGLGMNELFIRDAPPSLWPVVTDIQDLQSKVGSVIILVLAVTFLSRLA